MGKFSSVVILLFFFSSSIYSQSEHNITYWDYFKSDKEAIRISDSLQLPVLVASGKVYLMASECFPGRSSGGTENSVRRNSGGDQDNNTRKAGGDENANVRRAGGDENTISRNAGGDENANVRRSGGDENTVRRNAGGDENADVRRVGGDENIIKRNAGGDEDSRHRASGGSEYKFTCMLNSKNKIIIKLSSETYDDDIRIIYNGTIYKESSGVFKLK